MNKKQYLIIVLAFILLAGIVTYWYARRGEIKVVNNFTEEQTQAEADESSQNMVTSGDNAPPGSTVHDLPVPAGVAAARQALATRLSIDSRSVLVLTAYERDWPNSCLGLEGEGEFCAQVIVPGYEVTMRAKGKEYVYRANTDGSVVRAEN